MTPQEIDRFFRILAKELTPPVRIILTGAAVGSILGSARPSMDIDFAIEPKRKNTKSWREIERGIARAVQLSGLSVNYAQDIDRWGLISLMDYRRHTHLYRDFGAVEVRLLEPAYWSIGKMTRYLNPDVQDMIGTFRKQKIRPETLAEVWGNALKKSPPSSATLQFCQQVEHFLRTYGPKIWGKGFDPVAATAGFYRHAKINSSRG